MKFVLIVQKGTLLSLSITAYIHYLDDMTVAVNVVAFSVSGMAGLRRT